MRAALLCFCLLGVTVFAQSGKSYRTRLAPVPIDVTMQATVAGAGTVTATLAGSKLTVSGTFEGLKSPATIAKLRKSPVRGVRGPEIFDLTVTQATSGSVAGTLELSAQQIADLQAGRLYIQVNSERAPEGNLWGWLMEKR
jgi:CHRD domain